MRVDFSMLLKSDGKRKREHHSIIKWKIIVFPFHSKTIIAKAVQIAVFLLL
jgi:hypothetical protein